MNARYNMKYKKEVLRHRRIQLIYTVNLYKSSYTVVHMENNTLISNNTRINFVFCVLTIVNLLLLNPVLKPRTLSTT